MSRVRPPVKIHGGKFYLSPWVIEHFPINYEQLSYCELCCGGASVFLNKIPSDDEMINDCDRGVVSIFKALRDEPQEMIERLSKIPYTLEIFEQAQENAKENITDYVDLAVNEFVLRRMSRGGMKRAFSWSNRQRGGQPGDVNAWQSIISLLPKIAERVRGVIILNQSFKDVGKVWDDRNLLMYIDPPYLQETRTSKNVYENEMSTCDHIDLLTFARDSKCKMLISGYESPLYAKYLKGWRMSKVDIANHSGQGTTKTRRVETLWMNYS